MDWLFSYDGNGYRDNRDYSFLAADRPSFQCIGKPREIHGPNGELVIKWPCGRILPDFCFTPRWRMYTSSKYRPVMLRCIACEQEIREARKRLWEHETKARTALSHHMQRERDQGLHDIRSLADYEAITGVTVAVLADEFRRAEQQDLPCPHCEVPWSKMLGGWRMQMSLDRTDPTRMLALDNFTLKCRSGNSQRKNANPRIAAIRDAYWRLIRRERRGDGA
jgi:hypothetical protein